MATILLALDEIGLAMPLQESLESAGHAVHWDASQASNPTPDSFVGDLVVVSASQEDLRARAERWQNFERPFAVIAFGSTQSHRQSAHAASLPFVDASHDHVSIESAIQHAIDERFGTGLSPGHARGALRLGPKTGDAIQDATSILTQSKTVPIGTVGQSLDPYAYHYLTSLPLVESLREVRALSVPQLELIRLMDGAHTLVTIIDCGVVPKSEAARHVWAILSCQAARLTASPPDLSTPARRAVCMAQNHLATRHKRLERSTLYDVLEVLPTADQAQIQEAVLQLRVRYAPNALANIDLSAYKPLVDAIWKQILYAHKILSDRVDRANYNDTLQTRIPDCEDSWVFDTQEAEAASESYARGHQAMVQGDFFKAVSAIASACRKHPNHPIYETGLCWARYRAESSRQGVSPRELAHKERVSAETMMFGRRPWPNALVALGMLCVADGDPASAHWYLSEALTCKPDLPAAQKLLQRLSGRS